MRCPRYHNHRPARDFLSCTPLPARPANAVTAVLDHQPDTERQEHDEKDWHDWSSGNEADWAGGNEAERPCQDGKEEHEGYGPSKHGDLPVVAILPLASAVRADAMAAYDRAGR
jgi:hypothetical protein